MSATLDDRQISYLSSKISCARKALSDADIGGAGYELGRLAEGFAICVSGADIPQDSPQVMVTMTRRQQERMQEAYDIAKIALDSVIEAVLQAPPLGKEYFDPLMKIHNICIEAQKKVSGLLDETVREQRAEAEE